MALALILALLVGLAAPADAGCHGPLCVEVRREGGDVVLRARNRDPFASVSVGLGLARGRATTRPARAVLAPGEARDMVRVPGARDFDYSYDWLQGDWRATHAAATRYRLPWAAGAVPVVQSCGGRFSHQGEAVEAVDFGLPEGTPVLAARAGQVIEVRMQARAGGRSRRYYGTENRVLVAHDDGTIAVYGHLQHESARVRAGDRVGAGQMLGRSGNTGLSTAPHLHFEVYAPRPQGGRRTFRTVFETAAGAVACPRAGRSVAP